MIDPTTDNGLGLDPATVAHMVGHDDGGYLIATVYTKLSQRRALARAQQAMDAYARRAESQLSAASILRPMAICSATDVQRPKPGHQPI